MNKIQEIIFSHLPPAESFPQYIVYPRHGNKRQRKKWMKKHKPFFDKLFELTNKDYDWRGAQEQALKEIIFFGETKTSAEQLIKQFKI